MLEATATTEDNGVMVRCRRCNCDTWRFHVTTKFTIDTSELTLQEDVPYTEFRCASCGAKSTLAETARLEKSYRRIVARLGIQDIFIQGVPMTEYDPSTQDEGDIP